MSKDLINLIEELENFELKVNSYYDDRDYASFIDSILIGKIKSLQFYFQKLELKHLGQIIENIEFSNGEAIPTLEILRNYVLKEARKFSSLVEPHADLPDDCKKYYLEARNIFQESPRASAALLRLVIQMLMLHLGEKGKNINDDIKSLVTKGLPDEIQQALDYCRVIGNNAVHPGEINLDDTSEIVQPLFEMINFIVEDRINRHKKIKQLYDKLPEKDRKSIQERNKLC